MAVCYPFGRKQGWRHRPSFDLSH